MRRHLKKRITHNYHVKAVYFGPTIGLQQRVQHWDGIVGLRVKVSGKELMKIREVVGAEMWPQVSVTDTKSIIIESLTYLGEY